MMFEHACALSLDFLMRQREEERAKLTAIAAIAMHLRGGEREIAKLTAIAAIAMNFFFYQANPTTTTTFIVAIIFSFCIDYTVLNQSKTTSICTATNRSVCVNQPFNIG